MTDFTLGTNSKSLEVLLSRDADFNATLRNTTGNYNAGVRVELRFNDAASTVWAATVSGTDAVFAVDKADVNTLLGNKPYVARLYYVDGTNDIFWASGPVVPQ